ncbi:hypothetical protein HOU02_gp206 [Caulobacter phage CcrBL9]|uniref:Uncharacterized protein n=1 Tax=Caulobacter phage CcrBL9 TaxID=2283270 RepID=A0A385EFQ9_9CAUD|nr:hypothetical protein HOU02_gp206 [Caulobacter phage CcrBL9]AXQ69519.1 hypothetical protein CcrBL9_gp495 [Caulobacter phage CcrBL9]
MPIGSHHRYVIGQRWYTSSEVQSLIVQTLPRLPAGKTAVRLDLEFGSADLSQKRISAMLQALAKQGRVRKVRHGHFEAVPRKPIHD